MVATFDGWVNSLHYNITAKVGDLGAVFAADRCAAGSPMQHTRGLPCVGSWGGWMH